MTHPVIQTPATRRQLLTMATIGGAGLLTGVAATPASADPGGSKGPKTYRLTVMGTTDTHGNVFNWDYFKNAEYTDGASNDVGLAKIATLVAGVRAERGAENCLLLDAGDTIQGTPLAYYYAKVDPITDGATHPMAEAMNAIGFDAAALGNHEFNYGLDTLRPSRSSSTSPSSAPTPSAGAAARPSSPRTSPGGSRPRAARTSRSASSASSPRAWRSGTRRTSRAR